MKPKAIYKSAVTGEIVSERMALENPDTTYKTTRKDNMPRKQKDEENPPETVKTTPEPNDEELRAIELEALAKTEADNEPDTIKELRRQIAVNAGEIVSDEEVAGLDAARAAEIDDADLHEKTRAQLEAARDKRETAKHRVDRDIQKKAERK